MLYRSALISLVSAAEWLVMQLIQVYVKRHPEAIGIRDKTLTLADLQAIGSIEEAQAMLIQSRIDEIMFGGLEDWLKMFANTMHLSMGYLKPRRDGLVDILQRRNVMVHNNGVVHSSYMRKVPLELRQGIELNTNLLVTPEYLESAIDLVEYSFVLIAAELWQDLEPNDEERGTVLTNAVAIERINSGRWLVAEGASEFTMRDKKLSEQIQLIGTINYWQTLKWDGRFDSVRKDVEAADYLAKAELYQLARLVLLDQFDTKHWNYYLGVGQN